MGPASARPTARQALWDLCDLWDAEIVLFGFLSRRDKELTAVHKIGTPSLREPQIEDEDENEKAYSFA